MMISSLRYLIWLVATLMTVPVYAQPRIDVQMVTLDAGGTYHLESQIFIEASLTTVWEVLTDYDHLDEFVPSMKRSEVKERHEDELLLEQEWVNRFLFFARTFSVLLVVKEESESSILFQDFSGKDFEFYEGSWRIEHSTEGVWVRYSLRMKPSFTAPGFVVKRVFKKIVENFLKDVRLEILRRERYL
jgi:ribosome-associated toxin RatA of RatAB toxin-antitoxin module